MYKSPCQRMFGSHFGLLRGLWESKAHRLRWCYASSRWTSMKTHHQWHLLIKECLLSELHGFKQTASLWILRGLRWWAPTGNRKSKWATAGFTTKVKVNFLIWGFQAAIACRQCNAAQPQPGAAHRLVDRICRTWSVATKGGKRFMMVLCILWWSKLLMVSIMAMN